MNDLHASLSRSLEIDRGVPARRRGDQAELGQALDDGARHRRALSHHADDVEWLQALDDGVGSARWSLKTVTVARPSSTDQSANERATFW